MRGFIEELKYRNVFRVAVAYVVVGWLIAQVADIVDVVYALVPADLRGAATHQVIVQLNKLLADERVRFPAGAAGPSTMVELIARQ